MLLSPRDPAEFQTRINVEFSTPVRVAKRSFQNLQISQVSLLAGRFRYTVQKTFRANRFSRADHDADREHKLKVSRDALRELSRTLLRGSKDSVQTLRND